MDLRAAMSERPANIDNPTLTEPQKRTILLDAFCRMAAKPRTYGVRVKQRECVRFPVRSPLAGFDFGREQSWHFSGEGNP